MGRHGLNWCREHGEQLATIGREFNSRKRTSKAVRPKAEVVTRQMRPEGDPEPAPSDKVPLEVRLAKLVAFVAENGSVSRKEAAAAIGLSPDGTQLGRIIRRGLAAGQIETYPGVIVAPALGSEAKARELGELVAAADAPLSRAKAAAAIDFPPVDGPFRRVLKRATELGLVEVRNGGQRGGLVPGPNADLPAAA